MNMSKGVARPDFVAQRHRIAAMFDQVAARYDFLNDFISFGLHRLARRILIAQLGIRRGMRVLDVCAGTGALARYAAARGAQVVLADASLAMLLRARVSAAHPLAVVADALALPFADDSFDCAMVGFALRSMADVAELFREMRRVVREGGLVASLEFTQPGRLIRPFFRAYLWLIIKVLARIVGGPAYSFLASTVAGVADAETVAAQMNQAGLRDIRIIKPLMGVVAIHIGRV